MSNTEERAGLAQLNKGQFPTRLDPGSMWYLCENDTVKINGN